MKSKPLTHDVAIFVRHHLGKRCFAPFTGADYSASRVAIERDELSDGTVMLRRHGCGAPHTTEHVQ